MIENLALGARPFQQFDGAVDRRAFFVAGDEKADRALEGAARDEAQSGGDRRGDAAFHVAGAAAPDHAVGDFAGERIEAPFADVARRHDIGMAGEDDMRRLRPDARIEIVDRRHAGLGEGDDFGGEARLGRAGRADRAARRRRPA